MNGDCTFTTLSPHLIDWRWTTLPSDFRPKMIKDDSRQEFVEEFLSRLPPLDGKRVLFEAQVIRLHEVLHYPPVSHIYEDAKLRVLNATPLTS